MLFTAIAALDQNRLIAGAEGIPWKLPRDSRHFRATTNGHHILLGRTTYEQMIGWFDCHIPLVLTTNPDYALRPDRRGRTPGVVVHSVEEAIEIARNVGETELFNGGGGLVYATTLSQMDRLLLTRIEHAFPVPEGAVYFPEINPGSWALEGVQEFPANEENAFAFRIEDWRRVR